MDAVRISFFAKTFASQLVIFANHLSRVGNLASPSIFRAQCRFFHRQYNKGAQKFKNPDYIQSLTMGRGGAAIDPSERWNQGRAMETPEQAERRLNRSGEVRNFR